ncbi:SDR family NAD(P)-dependent oxidoreductase [Fulvivirgaceae bacterium BMA10]|uniref:SDR family NAD(P)-dependent oxidoreductase n=1 Tax=Splendidivirga corallicola TaxID=3051826 RepID=A0ABT8KUQ5_9BACT|nr:SDR family NAD(P)-dependent oxidoreductase [Fulvivirgaceae bacterium BMA10]
MQKIALITGATSGIGEACARLLGTQGFKLILCGRRVERLQNLKNDLETATRVTILNFDVSNREEVFRSINSLPEDFKEIDILINNAGNAHGLGPIHEGNLDDWDAMMDINVKGLLYVSKAVVPGMVARKRGHVVNIGSIAGKEVYPNGNVYCASKHAVDALNRAMLIDLNQYGIKVTSINPGLVETEFSMVRFKGDEGRAKGVYKGIQPLRAEDVAETISFVISRPAHVNLSDIVIFPTAQASSTVVNRQLD